MKIITRMMLVLALLFGGLAGCNSQGGVGPIDPNRVYIPKDAIQITINFDETEIDSRVKSDIISTLRTQGCAYDEFPGGEHTVLGSTSEHLFRYLESAPPAFDFPFSPGIRYLRVDYKGEAPRELVIDGMLNTR